MTATPEHTFVIGTSAPRQQESALLGTLSLTALSFFPVGPTVGQHEGTLALSINQSPPPTVEARQSDHQDLAWLPEVYSLVDRSNPEAAADLVFDHVDDLLSAGEFPRCDELLQMVDVKRLDSNLMVSFLAITLAAKHELPSRPALVRRVESRLRELTPDRVEALLATLR